MGKFWSLVFETFWNWYLFFLLMVVVLVHKDSHRHANSLNNLKACRFVMVFYGKSNIVQHEILCWWYTSSMH